MAFYKNVLKQNLGITKGSENVCVFVTTDHLRKQLGDERPFEKSFLGVTKSNLRKQWGNDGPFEKWFLGVTKSHLRKRSGDEIPIEKMWKSLPERELIGYHKAKSDNLWQAAGRNRKFKQAKENLLRKFSQMKNDESSERQSRFYHFIVFIWAILAYRFPACW